MNPISLPSSSRRWRWIICLILTGLTLAVYWPVRNFAFVNIDDWSYVTQNPEIQRGFSCANFKWAFTTRYASNWHPVTTLSHMLDCQLFGLKAGAHHLTNLWFHLANTLLLFAVLQRMTRALWRSAIVAGFFALHPLHVESVAWISERKDVLCGFFFLLTLWFYVAYQNDEKQNHRVRMQNYFLALLCFALGLLSKPMLVTLPFVLLLLDFWPLERMNRTRWPQLFLEKIPFFALAMASSVVTFFVQQGGGAVVPLQAFPIHLRAANAIVSYARYLGKTFWPDGLAVFYPYRGGWAAWQIAGSILLLVVVTIALALVARRQKFLLIGWLWFLGILVPVIGLVQVGSQSMADRYTYLPLIGIFFALVWGITEIITNKSARLIAFSAGTVLLLICAFLTSQQVRTWQNTETLLTHAVNVTTGNAPAHYYLGYVLEEKKQVAEAMDHYREAIRFGPELVSAHYRLAELYAGQKKIDLAREQFLAALHHQPDWPTGRFGYAQFLVKQKENEAAKAQYRAAIQSKPDFAEAYYQLAVLFSEEKKTGEAISHYKEAIRFKPDWLEPLNNLAWILATHSEEKFRDGKLALELVQRADRISSHQNPGVLDTLAAAYAEAGRFGDAIRTAGSALAMATAEKQTKFAEDIQTHLKLYQAGQPLRE